MAGLLLLPRKISEREAQLHKVVAYPRPCKEDRTALLLYLLPLHAATKLLRQSPESTSPLCSRPLTAVAALTYGRSRSSAADAEPATTLTGRSAGEDVTARCRAPMDNSPARSLS
jgi:hypothetical protein